MTRNANDYIEISGRKFVLYKTLLSNAEEEGLKRLEVDILQYPSEENKNTCVCKATAEMKSGKIASDIGEANAETLDGEVSKFLFSMASTRSKARCLRNILAEGTTCLEECGAIEDLKTDENTTKTIQETAVKRVRLSSKQHQFLHTLATEAGLDREELDANCLNKYGVVLDHLEKKEASELIKTFRSQKGPDSTIKKAA